MQRPCIEKYIVKVYRLGAWLEVPWDYGLWFIQCVEHRNGPQMKIEIEVFIAVIVYWCRFDSWIKDFGMDWQLATISPVPSGTTLVVTSEVATWRWWGHPVVGSRLIGFFSLLAFLLLSFEFCYDCIIMGILAIFVLTNAVINFGVTN
jgi:hypothetical protein